MLNGITHGRFANTGCIGSGSKNGTCYTTSECAEKSGVAAGTCAQGYGVCCVCEIYL